jgi:hypothetical protein
MIRKTLAFLVVPAFLTAFLTGCSSNSTTIHGCTASCPASPQGTVYMTMADDPPAGVTVLSFDVTLTSATLTPTSGTPVSLLNNIVNFGSASPPQIDVTQLQAVTSFLSSAQVPPGMYTSLNLTLANPQLVIYNQSDASLGSSCAVGSICELTPSFDNNSSTLAFSSSPFPVMVNESGLAGFLIDFHLNTVIQPDLSLNLAVADGVAVSQLPATPAAAQLGSITGTVGTVIASTGVFTVGAPWGGTFDIATTSSTAFNNFPSSACTTPGIGCLAQGQIVTVQISSMVATGYSGVLTASAVDYVQAANAQTVEGTVIEILPLPVPAGELIVDVLLHSNPTSASGFPLGGIATVTLASSATYAIDNNGFTIPSGLSFTGEEDIAVGQNLQLVVSPGTLTTNGSGPGSSAWGPPPAIAFTASSVELEPSQMTGSITAIDSSATSFTMGVAGQFFAPWPLSSAVSSFNVVTTGQTSYTGFNPDSFSGLATGDFVSVNGWLFPPTSGSTPVIAAQSVVSRPTAAF